MCENKVSTYNSSHRASPLKVSYEVSSFNCSSTLLILYIYLKIINILCAFFHLINFFKYFFF